MENASIKFSPLDPPASDEEMDSLVSDKHERFPTPTKRSPLGTLLTLSIALVVLLNFGFFAFTRGARSGVEESKERSVVETRSKVFGHVHMAKTAGSEINDMLASRYERVCGNKGASSWMAQYVRDKNAGLSPRRPQPETFGFDDCDYISLEQDASDWNHTLNQTGPLEMHVPCRDPIEHVLSQCNFHDRKFKCSKNKTELAIAARYCIFQMHRFPEHDTSWMERKCFNPIPVENYVEYMGQFLQPRRKEVPYYHPVMNKPRDKGSECLETDLEAQAYVRELLITRYPYYRFCNECIGSTNDLLAHWKRE